MQKAPENLSDFSSLAKVIEILCSPEGCPWDQKQSHSSLAPFAIEEANELAEAIEKGNDQEICDELGDVLLQVLLHSEKAKLRGAFQLKDVIQNLAEKMVRRHPHVFDETYSDGKTDEAISSNWADIKKQERETKGNTSSEAHALFDFPKTLPELMKSQKIGKRSKKFNFDWPNYEGVLNKVEEELSEVKQAIKEQSLEQQKDEIGDLLFSIAQLSRHLGFESNEALRHANLKFKNRFLMMAEFASSEGTPLEELSSTELEKLWEQAKKQT